jgi:uncharacterized membrane protein
MRVESHPAPGVGHDAGMIQSEGKLKIALRWVLTAFMVAAGINHFVSPEPYVAMMPAALPAPLALVYISGVAEVLGGLGLILPATRRLAAWGLIVLFIAIFPANVNMAVNQLTLGSDPIPAWVLWARLPMQAVLVAWAWWYTRPAVATERAAGREQPAPASR